MIRTIIAYDEHPATAHDIAATTAFLSLPAAVRVAAERRALAVRNRNIICRRWPADIVAVDRESQSRDIGADRSVDEGLEL